MDSRLRQTQADGLAEAESEQKRAEAERTLANMEKELKEKLLNM